MRYGHTQRACYQQRAPAQFVHEPNGKNGKYQINQSDINRRPNNGDAYRQSADNPVYIEKNKTCSKR
jgi:hypothetical protein